MVLDVERHGGSEPVVAEQREVHRLPADGPADAAAGFEGVEESVLHKR
jgi:hypothetical protein